MFHSVRQTRIKSLTLPTVSCHKCETRYLCLPRQPPFKLHICIFSEFKCGWTMARPSARCSFIWCRSSFFYLYFKLHSSRHRPLMQELNDADESCIQSCYNLCCFCQHLPWRFKVKFASGVSIIIVSICCLWAMGRGFKKKHRTRDHPGFTVLGNG